jgi:DNA-binding transcriptional ArsR family regulator
MPGIARRADEEPGTGAPLCEPEAHTPLERSSFSVKAFRRAAALFRALGDAERLKLLDALTDREVCVTELAQASKAHMPTVSQRLRVLRAEGLVVQRREGKHIFYTLADQHVVALVRNALQHASEEHGGGRGSGDAGPEDGA